MSLLTKIKSFIGGVFKTASKVNNTASAIGGLDYNTKDNKDLQKQNKGLPAYGTDAYYNTNENYNKAIGANNPGSIQTGGSQPNSYSPTYKAPISYMTKASGGAYSSVSGSGPSNQYMTKASGSGNSIGASEQTAYRFDDQSAKTYAKSAGLNNLNLSGLTQEEADQMIEAKKAEQMGQNTALTSAVFADPNSISSTSKKMDSFGLSLDKIKNDTWASAGTKAEKTKNLLQATAKDLAIDYNSPEELASAYHNDPIAQAALDKFIQAGGTDQMIGEAILEKNSTKTPNNMTTAEYLASDQKIQEDQAIRDLVPESTLIQNRIAEQAKIPENLKSLYFGDENTTGLLNERITLAKENIKSLEKQMKADEKNLRRVADLQIKKNNEELDVARNTIEQNRVNAKNYVTGMLAKLGALQTTSAAVEGIASLDQKYQQQISDAESKVKYANREIETKLRDGINDIETRTNTKIEAVKEDLSKDTDDIQKEIAKTEQASDKEIFNLSLKLTTAMKKNVEKYTSNAKTLAEKYTQDFTSLVSGGMDPAKVAGTLNVAIPKADQQISQSARIKDPNAISYFKSLPKEFRDEWIQFASPQEAGRYFTLADLQYNYEAYQSSQTFDANAKKKASKSGREL